MTIHVLIADNDSGIHELVNDMLHINFKDVSVERVRDRDSFRSKLRIGMSTYDLIVFDGYPTDNDGQEFINSLKEEFPGIMSKVIMLCGSDCNIHPDQCEIPCLIKPFSLDDFGEIVKKICAT
ncbi:MAG TPA: hypothetical protein DCO75_11815 [Fibrobacteres bacterium]|jgi:DNA-binding NtrC family response regulator|nr:hypothetical protein [Fibrobacterota bacterium]